MNKDDFVARMRALEYFHGLRLVPGAWTIVRVDGRGFSRFTEAHFEKPCDERFRDLMVATAQALLEEMQGRYVYTESDEISVLFPPGWELFDREVEKIVSVSAGIASAAFTAACGERAHFDSRVCVAANPELVVDYFRWRQEDAARCALNGWCYWTLRKAGHSVRQATRRLEGQTQEFKHALLHEHGIEFHALPAWQRRGIGLYWETYEKTGFNPVKGETVLATRRRVRHDWELSTKQEYEQFILGLTHENQQAQQPGTNTRYQQRQRLQQRKTRLLGLDA